MADEPTTLRVSREQMTRMTAITRTRAINAERTRISEEIAGRAAVERELGNEETALILDEMIAEIAKQEPMPTIKRGTPTTAQAQPQQPDINKLVVRGLEDEPFRGFFAEEAGLTDGLPPVAERDDEDDVRRLVR